MTGIEISSPERALRRIEPGMCILLGTGPAEPRTLLKHLLASEATNLQDLELIQLISLADTLSAEALSSKRLRLKTFFPGWVASDAIASGQVDLIPSRFSRIPDLIRRGLVALDAVFLQITPPDRAGYCNLGLGVDVARAVIEQASFVVAEVSERMPRTYGDTLVHVSEIDCAVLATQDPVYFQRWPVDEVIDRVAVNVASIIEDGSCIAFSVGPLYDALGKHLAQKRHLGVHSGIFTDALMDLVKQGAVSNLRKETCRGRSVASYAIGTPELMTWLDRNPKVDFQSLDRVFDPARIGRNNNFVVVMPAEKVDLTGRIALHHGRGMVAAGPAEATDFLRGAELSRGGRTVLALRSRNRCGESNVEVSLDCCPNQVSLRESIDMVITEYGIANLRGRTVRERAQALIEIAHPCDRVSLVDQAKKQNILYADQIYLDESAHLIPMNISTQHTFSDGLSLRFRALRPSDEEGMRRLFYRFSSESRYLRFFTALKAMPHAKMQQYVNVDYRNALSIVGLEGPSGQGRIVAEARYVLGQKSRDAEIAIFVDENYQKRGIGTAMIKTLIRLARHRGIPALTADILSSNRAMIRVIEKCDQPVTSTFDCGVYEVRMQIAE